MKTLTTLIVADDHPIFLEGLIMLFERLECFELLASATDGDQALAMIEQYQPNIALIDLSMTGVSIEHMIEHLKQNSFDTKLIVLTMLKDSYRAQQLLSLGLAGYVLKDMAFEDLITSIEQVLLNKSFISPSLICEEVSLVVIPCLTERELEVLTCVASGDSNKQIARKLGISQRTVCFHMTNCFIKTDASNRTEAIVKAVSYGLIDIV
ncbi:response regulator transcription factor [Psychrobacter sp. AH5]|uniref:response regulator transcription factor n=1 Tax=Psychrobacter sp. AH5 TaxID=2937433 RepID=UPI00333E98AA